MKGERRVGMVLVTMALAGNALGNITVKRLFSEEMDKSVYGPVKRLFSEEMDKSVYGPVKRLFSEEMDKSVYGPVKRLFSEEMDKSVYGPISNHVLSLGKTKIIYTVYYSSKLQSSHEKTPGETSEIHDTIIKMALIKQESEDIKIEEVFSVKHEDTEEQTDLMVPKEELKTEKSQELNNIEEKDEKPFLRLDLTTLTIAPFLIHPNLYLSFGVARIGPRKFIGSCMAAQTAISKSPRHLSITNSFLSPFLVAPGHT
ncbi:unnamed protein product [Leuciscus chuanchicus]